ncbi:MAG: prepilin-type N-terminal cleavage/methylation domain-containing protein [Alphaproteobacteria bacterium]|nr:prepilin-type N-terminal cleavage/methylation domain-containing protein [Alphaproteobacteria bacterium]
MSKNCSKNFHPRCNGPAGFTLIEMSFVLLISSIMLIPLLMLYYQYDLNRKIEITKSNMANAETVMAVFSPLRYPCPADRSLRPGAANYGVDVCTVAGFTLAGVPNCNTTGNEQGFCKIPGARDTVDDTDNIVGNNNEFVLIGGIPTISGGLLIAGMPDEKTLDGWGRKLNYAVSFTSARPNRPEGFSRFQNGVINVVDEFGNNTAGVNNDGQFVIYSSGETGLGAYNANGIFTPCNIATSDGENCDGDFTFRQALANSEGAGGGFFDDRLLAYNVSGGDLWMSVTDNNFLPTTHMRPFFTGAVGIGTDTPATAPPAGANNLMLDVSGTLKAGAIRTDNLCNVNGTFCLNVNSNTGFFGNRQPGVNSCATPGNVMTGISSGQVVCAAPTIAAPGVDKTCPSGSFLKGLLSDGKIICSNGQTY